MATLYRSIWGADSVEAVRTVERVFLRWATERARAAYFPLPETPGRVRASEKNRFVLRHDVYEADEDSKIRLAVRVNLVEAVGTGVRRTWVRACAGGSVEGEGVQAWVWVDVEEVTDDLVVELQVQRPEFVPEILGSTGASRREIALRPSARHFQGEEGAEELGEMLTQHDRDVPVVVLADPEASATADALPEGAVERTADALAGLAVVAHVDRSAREFLGAVVGDDYGVRAGGMRLYFPALDPASGVPARHREFGPAELRGGAERLALEGIERFAVSRRAPRSWDHAWRRLDDAIPSADVLERMEARRIERVRALEEELEETAELAEDLSEDLRHAETVNADLRDRLVEAHHTLGRLRQGLDDDGLAAPGPSETANPRSCAEAVALARQLFADNVDLPSTLDREVTALDSHGTNPAWARKLFEALRAFDAYVRARRDGFTGDVRRWCESSSDPAVLPPRAVAMGESSTTIARWGEQRVFSVDGEDVPMYARVRISRWRQVAPRVHFAYLERTGRVHVGRIGPHLTNTRTS